MNRYKDQPQEENQNDSPLLGRGDGGEAFSISAEITGAAAEAISLTHCLQLLEEKGKQSINPSFEVLNSDHELIAKLFCYFFRDEEKAKQYHLNLNKGILLCGPVGCGKTSLMLLMRHFLPPTHRHIMKSCRDISFDFIQDGYEVIHRYSRQAINERSGELPIYCFDDLGTESNLKYYGNECNVMAEVLLSRYDLFISRKLVTHITTNLNSSEIEKLYGNRVRSRMREMFNLIAFDKRAEDKRR